MLVFVEAGPVDIAVGCLGCLGTQCTVVAGCSVAFAAFGPLIFCKNLCYKSSSLSFLCFFSLEMWSLFSWMWYFYIWTNLIINILLNLINNVNKILFLLIIIDEMFLYVFDNIFIYMCYIYLFIYNCKNNFQSLCLEY